MESSDEEPRRKEKKHRDEDRVKDKKKHKKEKKEKKHKKDGEHKEKKRKKDKKERKDDETKQKKKRRPHPITKPLPDAIKASGLSPLELEPRKSWRSINPSHKTHCLTMVDHAIMSALGAEKNPEEAARLDKALRGLRQKIAEDLDVIRTPPAVPETQRRFLEENVAATREFLVNVKREQLFEEKAYAAENEKVQDLKQEVAALERRLKELHSQKAHPILRDQSDEVQPWPEDIPLQANALEVLIQPTDDPEFERLKAQTAKHLQLLPAHEAAVAPVLEELSRLKEHLTLLLDVDM